MNAIAGTNVAEVHYRGCAHCDSPQGEFICTACATEEQSIDVRAWLEREKTKLPGLTNSEVALIERLISDLESS